MAKLKMSDVKVHGIYKMKTENLSSFGIGKGDSVKVTYINGHNINVVDVNNPGGQQLGVTIAQLDFYQRSKAQIEKEIDAAKLSIQENEAKLQWMKATNNEEFDEDEFKVWHTLQILGKPGITDTEKAKAIAALIKK